MAKEPRTEAAEPSRGGHHAGQQQAQLVEIAAIERQPLHLAVVDDAADGGGVGAQQAAGGGDGDLLGGLAGEQGHFDADFLIQIED
jgi:hypothetical protein